MAAPIDSKEQDSLSRPKKRRSFNVCMSSFSKQTPAGAPPQVKCEMRQEVMHSLNHTKRRMKATSVKLSRRKATTCTKTSPVLDAPSETKRRRYDPRLLKAAFDHIRENDTSVYKAAKMFGVPESTLRDRTLGLQSIETNGEGFFASNGPSTTFTKSEEKELVEHAALMDSIGNGYTKQEFMQAAYEFAISLQKKGTDDPPFGDSWYSGFKRRNSGLIVNPTRFKADRTTELEHDSNYSKELKKLCHDNNLVKCPHNIWVLNDTGIELDHSTPHKLCNMGDNSKIVTIDKGGNSETITSEKGDNPAETETISGRQTVSILAGGNAVGNRVPPFFIFAGKKWNHRLLEGASPGAAGTTTESGMSNLSVFRKYIDQHFLQHVQTKYSPAIVLLDGNKKHVCLTLRKWGSIHNIVFFLQPPHMSEKPQQFDEDCFGSLKQAYCSELKSHYESDTDMVAKGMAQILSEAYDKGFTPDGLVTSFRKHGIYRLNASTDISNREMTMETLSGRKRKHQSVADAAAEKEMSSDEVDEPDLDTNGLPDVAISKDEASSDEDPAPDTNTRRLKDASTQLSFELPRPGAGSSHLPNGCATDKERTDRPPLLKTCEKTELQHLEVEYLRAATANQIAKSHLIADLRDALTKVNTALDRLNDGYF